MVQLATDPLTVRGVCYVGAYVDPELKQELERLARSRDRSVSAELRRALRFYLSTPDSEEEAR